MLLTALGPTIIERLLVLETEAQHLTALTAVADACAYVAREKADAAHRSLSELKVFIALLPDDAALELRASMPNAAEPAKRLGVKLRPKTTSDSSRERAPRSDRAKKPLSHPLAGLAMLR